MNKRKIKLIAFWAFLSALICSVGIISVFATKAPQTGLKRATEHIPTTETVEECVLKANQKYSDTIKAHGDTVSLEETTITVMTPEEWHVIDDQRVADTKSCQNKSTN